MAPGSYKFGEFELDGDRFELRRNGKALKLERIPLELLILLAEKNGNVVTRQEIVNRLWGKEVFVDTEHGINTAIRKIRAALRDDAERSRYIQTVSGKGYRFVAQLSNGNGSDEKAPAISETRSVTKDEASPTPFAAHTAKHRTWKLMGAFLVCLMLGCVLLAFNFAGLPDRFLGTHQPGPIHSLAVLPLANLSGDPSQDYYADGMTDELITMLAKNSTLRVISRTSAAQYKGARRQLRDVGRELGVDGILEGSVARSGNHVHMTVQLIHAPSDTHIWAESYDRDLTESLSLPSEVSLAIAKELKTAVGPVKPARYINPEAHDAYLRGRYYWFGGNYDKSEAYFEKAIQLQPDYAVAWDGLSDTYGSRATTRVCPPRECFPKAQQAIRKALELDDSVPEVHNSLAGLAFFYDWDFQRAETESQRALELNPNYAEGHHLYSYILLALNRDYDALQKQKRASELDPFARPWALGMIYILLRRYDEAISELRSRADVQPHDFAVEFLLATAYRHKGMKEETAQHYKRAFTVAGDEKSAAAVRQAVERGGSRGVEEWLLSRDLEESRKKYVSPIILAWDYARLGRKEDTLRALEEAYRQRAPRIAFLQKEPDFDFLHSDQRYRALVKKIGLVPTY